MYEKATQYLAGIQILMTPYEEFTNNFQYF